MMKILALVIPCLLCSLFAQGQSIFFNEIHYDNFSGDTDEGFEIAGPAGTILDCYKVIQYAGSGIQNSTVISLHGRIPDQCSGFGTLWFDAPGQMSNTGPRGLALVFDSNLNCCSTPGLDSVYHFVSYEGQILALDGAAIGMTSTATTFDESGSVPVGNSLQLTGLGTTYTDFPGWADPTITVATMGMPNQGQVFGPGPGCDPNSVAASQLTFTQRLSGCTIPGETFDLEVSATNVFGDIALSFASNISLSVAAGPGTLGGTLTQTASNGRAVFTGLSLSSVGTYTISAIGGPFAGEMRGTITASCDTCPWLTGVHVDACGSSEGNDEILFYNTGDYTVPVEDDFIQVFYGQTLPLGTNYTERLVGNPTYVNFLNAQAGCNLFVNAVDSAIIPPHTDFMIMRFDPTYPYNFGGLCAAGKQIYMVFTCDGNWGTLGNFKNALDCNTNGSQSRYFESRFNNLKNGDTCSFTNTYIPCGDLLTRGDGDGLSFSYWDSTYINRWVSCASPTVLPAAFGPELSGWITETGVELNWNTYFESEMNFFEIERANQAEGSFQRVGWLSALGQTSVPNAYQFLDPELPEGNRYYRVKAVDMNGSLVYSNALAVSPWHTDAGISMALNSDQDALIIQLQGEGKTNLQFWTVTGQKVYEDAFNDGAGFRTVDMPVQKLPNGIYLYQVMIGHTPFTGKFRLVR